MGTRTQRKDRPLLLLSESSIAGRIRAVLAVVLHLVCLSMARPETLPADAPAEARSWLEQADLHHRTGALHLEVEALEQALPHLSPDDPLRRITARRLAEVCRGGLGRYGRAAYWMRTIADELRLTPEGIDALFDLADTEFNHGHVDEALAIYKEILGRIMAPDPPWERYDNRCWPAWHGEELAKYPKGSDPLFPSNLNATGQLGLFAQSVGSGAWMEACSLLDRDLTLHSPVEWRSEPRTWISARRWLAETIRALPADSVSEMVDFYRTSIEGIRTRQSWPELREYRFRHPIPAIEAILDVVIGDRLLDAGLPALASQHYGTAVRNLGDGAAPLLLAKDVYSRVCAGQSVGSFGQPEVEVELGGARHTLQEWAEIWTGPSRTESAARPPPFDLKTAVVSQLPLIRSPAVLYDWQVRWLAREVSELPRFAEEFVPLTPTGSARSLIVNTGTVVQALDLIDGRLLWTFSTPEENSMEFPNPVWRTRRGIVPCAETKHAVAVGDRVYCLLVWGHHNTTRLGGAIVALRREDGALLWSTLGRPELAGMQLVVGPAVDRGTVLALGWRPHETIPLFYTVGIAAETGEVLWVNHLFSGSSLTVRENEEYLERPPACGPPAVADGLAYFNTGAGVVAAVSTLDGSLHWAIQYPRVKAINDSEWATRMATSRPPGIIAVPDDLVLFAPIDSHYLLGIDRDTGEVRYQREKLDLRAIAAADSERAYLLEGTSVRAITPRDGETVWRRELPVTGIVGVPTLSGRGLWCPVWESLYLLDPATGAIIVSRPWRRDEACSAILDLGDRLVGTSRVGLHILAEAPLPWDHNRLLSPEMKGTPKEVGAPSRDDRWLRWVLASVNRGDFVLSRDDPDHMLIRSEILQLRKTEPVPSLCWQRLSPLPWGYFATFDRDHVALWDSDCLVVLGAATGQTLWEDRTPSGMRETPGSGAILSGTRLIRWGANRISCYQADTGEKRWESRPDERIWGVRLLKDGIGTYVGSGTVEAVLLDPDTGRERSRIPISLVAPIPRPLPTGEQARVRPAHLAPVIVGREGAGATATAADVIFVNGTAPVRVDWAHATVRVGQSIPIPLAEKAHGIELLVFDRYVALRGRDTDWHIYHEPLLGVWDLETLSLQRVPETNRWAISGDVLYGYHDHRLSAYDLREHRTRWRSETITDQCRLVFPTLGHVLLLTQDERWGQDDVRDVSYLRVLDPDTGEALKTWGIPKRWMHVIDFQPDRLFMWDCTFLYCVRPPAAELGSPGREMAIPEADPEAIAALRMARDLEEPPEVEIPELAAPPRIDADLSDWPDPITRRLESAMDWKPDFAQQNGRKPRTYGGKEDLAATVRLGRVEESFCIAVEVTDDTHVDSPTAGLWRGDCLTLFSAGAGGAEVEPALLSVALVGGVPRYEFGTAARMAAVSDLPGYQPGLPPGPRTFILSPFAGAGAARIPPGTTIEVAIHRDEVNSRTVYELKVPPVVWPIGAGNFWDLVIHEDDGLGREGALQIASSVWSVEETGLGAVRVRAPRRSE